MSDNFLQLNPDKIDVLIIGSENVSDKVKHYIGPLAVNVKQDKKNLWVTFDQHMNFESHVKKVVQSCFFQL